MFVTSYSVTYCIYIPGKPGICFHQYITLYHYHYCANFIWIHWTYKMPVRYNLSSVWVRLSIFFQLSIILYVGLCVFSLPIPFVMIERIYILCLIIIIKSEVWTITHCLGLGHETMVCAVCLSIFFLIHLAFVSYSSNDLLSDSCFHLSTLLNYWHAHTNTHTYINICIYTYIYIHTWTLWYFIIYITNLGIFMCGYMLG